MDSSVSRLVHLVRHGKAAAAWDEDPDPPLAREGLEQSLRVAAHFSSRGPLRVMSSPLLRCRQTAFPLATAWGTEVLIEPRVAEIPSPSGLGVASRGAWLTEAMAGTWAELAERSGSEYLAYRDAVARALCDVDEDAVVFSHFVAINAVIGLAVSDDRLVVARLDNCSVTTIRVEGDGSLELIQTGGEASTPVG